MKNFKLDDFDKYGVAWPFAIDKYLNNRDRRYTTMMVMASMRKGRGVRMPS